MLSKDERTLIYADKLGFGDEELQPMNRSDLDTLTDAVETAVLAKLREGGVELPAPALRRGIRIAGTMQRYYTEALRADAARLKDTLQDVRGHYERVCNERDVLLKERQE